MSQTKLVEKIKKKCMSFNNFFPPENRAVHETCKHTVEPYRTQKSIWRTRSACGITKATKTHSEYVIILLSHCPMVARTGLNVTLYVHCLSCYSVIGNTSELPLTP